MKLDKNKVSLNSSCGLLSVDKTGAEISKNFYINFIFLNKSHRKPLKNRVENVKVWLHTKLNVENDG